MFTINKLTGEVNLNRGDNASFSLCINQGSNLNPLHYKLKENDTIYFAVEEPNQPFENAILKKVINLKNNLLDKKGNITFDLTSNDTVCLMPGLYYYEIKAKLYKGNKYRNYYLVINFDTTKNEYSIVDEEISKCLTYGSFRKEDNTLIFIDKETENEYIATLTNDNTLLTFNNYEDIDFSGLTFKQEEDEVNTLIQQTRFIIER